MKLEPGTIINSLEIKSGSTQDLPTVIHENYNEEPIEFIVSDDSRYVVNALIKSTQSSVNDVYRGRDNRLKRDVAFKVCIFRIDHDNEVESLRREAQKAVQFRHPNLVETYDYALVRSSKNDTTYHSVIVMEYLHGMDLKDLAMELSGLDLNDATNCMYEVAKAVDYLHGLNVIHKDIKPANIMGYIDLTDTDLDVQYKLGDFTFAFNPKDRKSIKSFGLFTPNYSSKSILKGNKATFSDDRWSFIATLYTLISNQCPFILRRDESSGNWVIVKASRRLSNDEEMQKRYSPIKLKLIDKFFPKAFKSYKEFKTTKEIIDLFVEDVVRK